MSLFLQFMPSPWLLEEKDGPNEKTALEKLFEVQL